MLARPWLSLLNPPYVDLSSRWPDSDVAALRALFDRRGESEVEYDAPELCREGLGDDFQRLFIEMVLKHVELVLKARDAAAVSPLRLMLFGTAGTGKTQSVKILLQELKRALNSEHYEGHFVRVAAPTGCAAFNVRFGATTLHRLFHMLRANKFAELREGSPELAAIQEKMGAT